MEAICIQFGFPMFGGLEPRRSLSSPERIIHSLDFQPLAQHLKVRACGALRIVSSDGLFARRGDFRCGFVIAQYPSTRDIRGICTELPAAVGRQTSKGRPDPLPRFGHRTACDWLLPPDRLGFPASSSTTIFLCSPPVVSNAPVRVPTKGFLNKLSELPHSVFEPPPLHNTRAGPQCQSRNAS